MIKYIIFDIVTSENEKQRVLSPNKKLLEILFPKYISIIENENIKKTNTINSIVVLSENGNRMKLEDIIDINEEIDTFLSSKKNLIKKESTILHLLNFYNFCISEETIPLFSSKPYKNESTPLAKYINFYLNKLGLLTFDENYLREHKNKLSFLARIGDSLLLKDLLIKYNINTKVKDIIVSNSYFKSILVAKFGFLEFLNAEEHISGTFFELIYYCAVSQENDKIKNLLLASLVENVDSISLNKNDIFPVFK